MSKIQRLVFLVVLFWCAAAVSAWRLLSPPQPLVGGKTPLPTLAEDGWRLERPDLSDTLVALEQTPLWGVSRDGSPLPAPKSEAEKAEEAKPAVWRFVAAITRANERYALIVEEGQPAPRAVKEGDALPNEGKLLHVDAKTVVYIDRDKKRHTEHLSF